jgi:hypothetical protein
MRDKFTIGYLGWCSNIIEAYKYTCQQEYAVDRMGEQTSGQSHCSDEGRGCKTNCRDPQRWTKNGALEKEWTG